MKPMKGLKRLAWSGLALMSGMIINGFLNGDFFAEGSVLLGMVWGQVTMVDLYIAFAVIIAWVFYREDKWVWKGTWTVFILLTGSFAICLYLLVTLYRSNNNMRVFLMGHSKNK